MSIDNPRRIFRQSRRHGLRKFGLVLLILASAAAYAAIQPGAESSGSAPAHDAAVITAPPANVAVIDGETLRLGNQVVRLKDVNAPERGHSCAAGPDCGGRATAALASLVRGQDVQCRVSGYDRLGRPAARCDAGGQDVNVALVETGWARAGAPDLSAAEADARTHRRGIWLMN